MYFYDTSLKDFCSNDYASDIGIYVLYGVLDRSVEDFYPYFDFYTLLPMTVSFFY